MVLDLTFFAVAIPAAIFAGISKGGFGSGAAFVAAAILALVIDPGAALGVMLPLLMLIDVATLRPYWKKWHGPSSKYLILGGIPGVALGAWLYAVVSADAIRLLIGAICMAFVLYQLLRAWGVLRIAPQPFRAAVAAIAGVVAGFTSFVSHAGGPPAAVFLLSQKMSKTEYQATTVIVFWAINLLKFIPYAILGIFTATTALANLLLAPFALLGAWIGVVAHQRIPEGLFFGITYVLLILTGLRLIWVGLG